MDAAGIGQTELARRVGVRQPTIHKLLNDQRYGSTHLHKIARELATTPAYLSGETDDPTGALPDEPTFDSRTRELIDNFAVISAADQRAIVQLVQSLAGAIAPSATVHAPRSAFKGRVD